MDAKESQTVLRSPRSAFLLRCFRGVSLVIFFAFFVFGLVIYPTLYFVTFTHWGVTLTLIYFVLVNLSYFLSGLETTISAFFLIIWASNWVITLIFWIYLFPYVPTDQIGDLVPAHSLPLIASIIEYLVNRLPFSRKYYIFSVGTFLVYAALVLAPFTLVQETVYPGVTFTNVTTYILLIAILVICAAALEIGRIVKVKYLGIRKSIKANNSVAKSEHLLGPAEIEQSSYT